jgi:virulence-associated protein VagC
MTREELEDLLDDILPSYELSVNKKGRVIIITPFVEDETGELVDEDEDDLADEDDIFEMDEEPYVEDDDEDE